MQKQSLAILVTAARSICSGVLVVFLISELFLLLIRMLQLTTLMALGLLKFLKSLLILLVLHVPLPDCGSPSLAFFILFHHLLFRRLIKLRLLSTLI